VRLFGDSIASNMFLVGAAYQLGLVPVAAEHIEQAIELNGAAVEMNRNAFRFGRLAIHDRAALDRIVVPKARTAAPTSSLSEIVAFRARHLAAYQDEALAERYRSKVAWIAALEKERAPGRSGLAEAVARAYHKVLAYKDEYEVGRLFTDPAFKAALDAQFDGYRKLEFHLAPPLLARRSKSTGEPIKMRFGPWMMRVFRLLARAKGLRGTRWDVFGYTAERRQERQAIIDYEQILADLALRLSPANHAVAVALAALPEEIKGFGHVKHKTAEQAARRATELRAALAAPAPIQTAAE
jgi:indolepyruvate ferredoxin oxidoreductase